MDDTIHQDWDSPLVPRRRVRQAFALLVRGRVVSLGLAWGWTAQMFLLEPGSITVPGDWVGIAAGAVGVQAVVTAMLILAWPRAASLLLAVAASVCLLLIGGYDSIPWFPVVLAVAAWGLVVLGIVAGAILAGEPAALDALQRFAGRTGPRRRRLVETVCLLAIVSVTGWTAWRTAENRELRRIPATLQPELVAFVNAWNEPSSGRLREIVRSASKAGEWNDLLGVLRSRGWEDRRPAISAPSVVRSYGDSATVQYPLPGGRVNTYWEAAGDAWRLQFLTVQRT